MDVDDYDAEKAFQDSIKERPLNEAEKQIYNNAISHIRSHAKDGEASCHLAAELTGPLKTALIQKGFSIRTHFSIVTSETTYLISWHKQGCFTDNFLRKKVEQMESKLNELYNAPGMPGFLEAQESFHSASKFTHFDIIH